MSCTDTVGVNSFRFPVLFYLIKLAMFAGISSGPSPKILLQTDRFVQGSESDADPPSSLLSSKSDNSFLRNSIDISMSSSVSCFLNLRSRKEHTDSS